MTELSYFLNEIEQFSPLIKILIGILVFLIGLIISGIIGNIIVLFLNKLRLNQAFKRLGWEEALIRADIKTDMSRFVGELVKWCLAIVFLMVAAEIVGLPGFSDFLQKVLGYLPNVIIAILIFVVAVFLSDFSYRIIVASAEKAKISYSRFLGVAVRWAIWIFAILAILLQLGVAADIIRAILYGIIVMITLAGGLAFGLGGKDIAAEILRDLKKKLSKS